MARTYPVIVRFDYDDSPCSILIKGLNNLVKFIISSR